MAVIGGIGTLYQRYSRFPKNPFNRLCCKHRLIHIDQLRLGRRLNRPSFAAKLPSSPWCYEKRYLRSNRKLMHRRCSAQRFSAISFPGNISSCGKRVEPTGYETGNTAFFHPSEYSNSRWTLKGLQIHGVYTQDFQAIRNHILDLF